MTAGARSFLERLSEAIETDAEESEIVIATDELIVVEPDGRRRREEGGAEAVLVIRGPIEGRKRAVSKLLALIDR